MTETLLSIGVDIGTTTTQVVFSKLTLENTASYFSAPRAEIVETQVLFQSEIHFTPLLDQSRLDSKAVRSLVAKEFKNAGFRPEDTSTGAVIITGEAARKDNARAVLDGLSGMAGDFVVATAGPDLESAIAGKGSGARRYSEETGLTVANLDIGGGTTNAAVFAGGELVYAACYDIGGRHVRIGRDRAVEYISEPASRLAESFSLAIEPYRPANKELLRRLTRIMNSALEEALGMQPESGLAESLRTPGSSPGTRLPRLDAVSFSGGVADCVYNTGGEEFRFGDIGPMLGRSIAEGRLVSKLAQHRPEQTIRATVVGAGSHSVTVSGSTIAYAPEMLPRKNLPVLLLPREREKALYKGEKASLADAVGRFLRQRDEKEFVFGLRGRSGLSYKELTEAAAGIAAAADVHIPPGVNLYLSIEMDMAKALGQCLENQLAGKRHAICIDGVTLADGDYIDLGRPILGGVAIPVVVKTLVFG